MPTKKPTSPQATTPATQSASGKAAKPAQRDTARAKEQSDPKQVKAPKAGGVRGTGTAAAKNAKSAKSAKGAKAEKGLGPTRGSHPLRNSDFPQTYIEEITISLNDPDHAMRLAWTGPSTSAQEVGPFRTSPGAGAKGLNCDNVTTSRRSGSKCTPKGTHLVEGFQAALNSEPRATFVTWFVRRRGIALHYFPSVPSYAASHGCVRVEKKRVAQLIQDNARIGLTKVTVDGTWTKPAHQW